VRRRARGALPGAAGELAEYAARLRAAAGRGDAAAAERLPSAQSWLAMLRATGGDPEVGELFAVFARESYQP
jgi:hypothetical protein